MEPEPDPDWAQALADRHLLEALHLADHAASLESHGLIGRLREATASELGRAGVPVLQRRTLLAALEDEGRGWTSATTRNPLLPSP